MIKLIKLLDKEFVIFFLLLLFCSFIRLPYTFTSMISADEHVYFILGDLITKGELPHHNFFEIKPALVWYLYSIPQFLLSNNIIIIKIYGILIITFSSFFLFKLLIKNFNFFIAINSSLFFIFASCFIGTELPEVSFGIGLNVITQHFCNLFIILSLYFLFNDKNYLNIFFTALFFSLAVFTRYNYILCFPIFLVYFLSNKNTKSIFLSLIVGFITFLIIHISYLFSIDRLNDLINYFNFLKIYGNTNFKYLNDVLLKFSYFILSPLFYFNINNPRFFLSLFIWIFGFVGIIFFILNKKNDKFIYYFFLFFLIIALSLIAGQVAEHYLLSLAPFICFFSSLIINKILKSNFKYTVLIILFLSSALAVRTEYIWLLGRIYKQQPLMVGQEYEVYNFMLKNKINWKNSFYINYQILYFLTNEKPIHKLIFPTQYNEWGKIMYGYNKISAVYQDIFNKKPNLVLYDTRQWSIYANPEINDLIQKNLNQNYKEIYRTNNLILYQSCKNCIKQ